MSPVTNYTIAAPKLEDSIQQFDLKLRSDPFSQEFTVSGRNVSSPIVTLTAATEDLFLTNGRAGNSCPDWGFCGANRLSVPYLGLLVCELGLRMRSTSDFVCAR